MANAALPGAVGTVSFKYDPFGSRIDKASSSVTSAYSYDGDNRVEETNATGTAIARYAQTQNVDEPLAMWRSGAARYYQADGLKPLTSIPSPAPISRLSN